MVHIEHTQSNSMHIPLALLDVDVANKNVQFVAFMDKVLTKYLSF